MSLFNSFFDIGMDNSKLAKAFRQNEKTAKEYAAAEHVDVNQILIALNRASISKLK
tara:strand:- start:956 stop:1123 length:168 start_codon:yes stop_codon:yes gene_type:complete